MRLRPTSLRGRLVLGAVTAGLIFAVLFGVAATWRLHQVEQRAVRTALLSRLDLVRDEVRADGSLRPDRGHPRTDLVQVVGPDGRLLAASPALAGLGPLVPLAAVTAAGRPGVVVTRSLQRPDVDLAALGVPLVLPARGPSPPGTGALVVALDAEGFAAAGADLARLLLVGLAIVVVVVGLLSWRLAGHALRSVTGLTEEAEQVSAGAVTTGLPVPVGDAELARLVSALNRMLHRLQAGHARELAFAADAGHRLRTPLATLRAEAELALRDDDPDERTQALRRIVADVDQVTSVVDRMLARSRRAALAPAPLTAVLAAAQPRWARQAGLSGVAVRIDVSPEVTGTAMVIGLPEILDPIVDNALRHTTDGGGISVVAAPGPADGWVTVEVTNSGTGVPAELVTTLFDAWVSSRDASVAGGLGLWLARESARDQAGDVTLVDPTPARTTFRVTLPFTASPD